jgi:hypothetical protein
MQFTLTEYEGTRNVTVDITKQANQLHLHFAADDVKHVIWPAYSRLGREDSIWTSTCFELFIALPEREKYLELNFSPSGAWNAYQFSRYRQDMARTEDVSLTSLESDHGTLKATVNFHSMSLNDGLRLGPATILDDRQSGCRYFAIVHGDKPDFHDNTHHVLVASDQL